MSKFGAGDEQGGKLPAMHHNVPNTGNKSSDSAGLKDGLSMRSDMDSHEGGMSVGMDRDPITGNPTSRITSNPSKTSASKNGKNFDIC